MNDFYNFVRLATTLEPWLGHVIFVGGWAHRLHRMHPLSRDPGYEPLLTLDVDVVLPASADLASADIIGHLETAFEPEFLGNDRPPFAHYLLKDDASGFYAEFLTPLIGSAIKKGRPDVTGKIGGVVATKLRHLELLTVEPWSIDLGAIGGNTEKTVFIRVPNPVTFIAHKLLVLERRKKEDRAKDLLYVHDTIELFAENLDELRDLWTKAVRPTLSLNQISRLNSVMEAELGHVTDLARAAALAATARGLSPLSLLETARHGAMSIFGTA